MQDIIVEKPYQFVPRYRGTFWSSLIQGMNLFGRHLRKVEGVESNEVRGAEKLRASLQAGHGIMLAPNHTRTADPLAMGFLTSRLKCHVYAMASWHLFNQDWFTGWAIHKMGGFSVNREGVDRKAVNTAIEVLETAERPLVIFPEGAVSRTNDRLHTLLDGVALIARTAAKRRGKQGGKVVVHPMGIKYIYGGNIKRAIDDVLTDIEQRWTWRPQRDLPIRDRVAKVGRALLALKEMEYFGEPQHGELVERLPRLIDRLLGPLEVEWLGAEQSGSVVPRVKMLRTKILPEMIEGNVSEQERQRRWKQLADIYLSQQVSCYVPDYLSLPSKDRYLETIERFEEDVTDRARVHGQLKVILEVGDPIEVSPERNRRAKVDPLMEQIRTGMEAILSSLAPESELVDDRSPIADWQS